MAEVRARVAEAPPDSPARRALLAHLLFPMETRDYVLGVPAP